MVWLDLDEEKEEAVAFLWQMGSVIALFMTKSFPLKMKEIVAKDMEEINDHVAQEEVMAVVAEAKVKALVLVADLAEETAGNNRFLCL